MPKWETPALSVTAHVGAENQLQQVAYWSPHGGHGMYMANDINHFVAFPLRSLYNSMSLKPPLYDSCWISSEAFLVPMEMTM